MVIQIDTLDNTLVTLTLGSIMAVVEGHNSHLLLNSGTVIPVKLEVAIKVGQLLEDHYGGVIYA